MLSDLALHAAVRTALRAVLGSGALRVGMIVRDGVVSLSGDVDTSEARIAAASAVRGVAGVRAVADGLNVTNAHPLLRIS